MELHIPSQISIFITSIKYNTLGIAVLVNESYKHMLSKRVINSILLLTNDGRLLLFNTLMFRAFNAGGSVPLLKPPKRMI